MVKKITWLIIPLLLLCSGVNYAQSTLEGCFTGNYTYYWDFEPGYGMSLEGRLVTEKQHKLSIGLQYLRAAIEENDFWLNGAEAEGGYYYEPMESTGDMSAFCLEVAPMFKLNKSNTVRNYIGLGLNLVRVQVKEEGSYIKRNYNNTIVDTINYSFEASGSAPGFRLFFESQWFYNSQFAATFGFGFRYAGINKLKIDHIEDQRIYTDPGSYQVGGFHMYVGITYQFNRSVKAD